MSTNTRGTAFTWTTGSPNQYSGSQGNVTPAPPPVQPMLFAWAQDTDAWTDFADGSGNRAWTDESA